MDRLRVDVLEGHAAKGEEPVQRPLERPDVALQTRVGIEGPRPSAPPAHSMGRCTRPSACSCAPSPEAETPGREAPEGGCARVHESAREESDERQRRRRRDQSRASPRVRRGRPVGRRRPVHDLLRNLGPAARGGRGAREERSGEDQAGTDEAREKPPACARGRHGSDCHVALMVTLSGRGKEIWSWFESGQSPPEELGGKPPLE